MKKVVLGTPDDLASLEPRIPGELIAICRKAIERTPEDRYQSAKELADEVQRFQAGGFVQAHTYQLSDLVCWVVRRYKPVVFTACFALVALAAVGTYSYANIRTARIQEHVQRIESESRLYEVSINLAQRHVNDAKLDVARRTLSECSPSLRNWEWGRLRYVCDATSVVLTGHTARVLDAAFSPDGSHVVTLGEDNAAILWDTARGEEVLRVDPGLVTFGRVAFSPDGGEFATCGSEGLVKIWSAETGALSETLKSERGEALAVSYTPDGKRIVGGLGGGAIQVWNRESMRTERLCDTGGAAVQSVVTNAAGTIVAAGCSNGAILTFNVTTGETVSEILAHPINLHKGVLGVTDVAFRPNHDQIASCGCDDTAKLWDLNTGQLLQTFHGHGQKVWTVSFTPDGRTLATSSSDGEVKTWDPDSGVERTRAIGLNEGIVCARYSSDGRHLVTAGDNPVVRIWNEAEPFGAFPLRGHTADVNAAAFSLDDRILASGAGHWSAGGDSRVILWDVATHRILRVLEGHFGMVYAVAFHPNGRWVTSAGGDRRVITWDIDTGDIVREFSADLHQNGIRSIAYSPDGSRFLTGGWDGDNGIASVAVIWDAASGTALHTLVPHGSVLDSVAWSPDGALVATACRDGVARVWDAESGSLVWELKADVESEHWAYSVVFDPRGGRLASAYSSGAIFIWDLSTGRRVQQLTGHSIRVNNLTYSPDGSRLASCDNSGVNVWNPDSGALLLSLPNGSNEVAFSHDALTLATAGINGDVILWPALPWQ